MGREIPLPGREENNSVNSERPRAENEYVDKEVIGPHTERLVMGACSDRQVVGNHTQSLDEETSIHSKDKLEFLLDNGIFPEVDEPPKQAVSSVQPEQEM